MLSKLILICRQAHLNPKQRIRTQLLLTSWDGLLLTTNFGATYSHFLFLNVHISRLLFREEYIKHHLIFLLASNKTHKSVYKNKTIVFTLHYAQRLLHSSSSSSSRRNEVIIITLFMFPFIHSFIPSLSLSRFSPLLYGGAFRSSFSSRAHNKHFVPIQWVSLSLSPDAFVLLLMYAIDKMVQRALFIRSRKGYKVWCTMYTYIYRHTLSDGQYFHTFFCSMSSFFRKFECREATWLDWVNGWTIQINSWFLILWLEELN